MSSASRLPVEVWAPLPPLPSGVADYVEEQLDSLQSDLALTLVAENPDSIDPQLRNRYPVLSPAASDASRVRLYHIGNSALHGYIYREAVRVPGIVVLHEWNLHELLLGFAVASNDFEAYRRQMRREHGERGSVAAETIAAALGGRHWTALFPLNAEVLDRALAIVSLSGATAEKVARRIPGTPVLHLPFHAALRSTTDSRSAAKARLGFEEDTRIILAPGLETESKSLDSARAAIEMIRPRIPKAMLVTVGGGSAPVGGGSGRSEIVLGRVDLATLGDALVAADVVLALRFPSRGETSGVLMRALAAGRATIVSSGSTADTDLPDGVVARVLPGPGETAHLAAVLSFLLTDPGARHRMEELSRVVASTRPVGPLGRKLADFVRAVGARRQELESAMHARHAHDRDVREAIRDEIDAAASSLALAYLPANVFERLAGL